MRLEDIPVAAVVALTAFDMPVDEDTTRRQRDRIAHLLRTDPGGAFVFERGGAVIGVALALIRERVWFLSLLTVLPDAQSGGAGRALMDCTLAYGRACEASTITSSDDPRAEHLYRHADFELRPTVQFEGTLDRSEQAPSHPLIRIAGQADIAGLSTISRALRGGAHTPDLEFALSQGHVVLTFFERGFVVLAPGRAVLMLAALDEQAASALLWEALVRVGAGEKTLVRWVTAEQRWAVDLARRAGLDIVAYGSLAVRGSPGVLHPYLPWGSFG